MLKFYKNKAFRWLIIGSSDKFVCFFETLLQLRQKIVFIAFLKMRFCRSILPLLVYYHLWNLNKSYFFPDIQWCQAVRKKEIVFSAPAFLCFQSKIQSCQSYLRHLCWLWRRHYNLKNYRNSFSCCRRGNLISDSLYSSWPV